MKKRKALKGFTLVEVMTSLVILSILIVIASGVIITTFNIFARNTLMRVAQDNGNNVYNTIYDHISCATALKIDKTVDINDKGSLSFLDPGKLVMDDNINDKVSDIEDYYELMTISGDEMKLNRKTVSVPVFIYGEEVLIRAHDNNNNGKESGSKKDKNVVERRNTMNGCSCIVSFQRYTEGAETLHFSVSIERDGEVYYSRSGDIPLLNEEVKSHISVPADIDCRSNDIKVFYTYLQ